VADAQSTGDTLEFSQFTGRRRVLRALTSVGKRWRRVARGALPLAASRRGRGGGGGCSVQN
jgi:hypothetical protein